MGAEEVFAAVQLGVGSAGLTIAAVGLRGEFGLTLLNSHQRQDGGFNFIIIFFLRLQGIL